MGFPDKRCKIGIWSQLVSNQLSIIRHDTVIAYIWARLQHSLMKNKSLTIAVNVIQMLFIHWPASEKWHTLVILAQKTFLPLKSIYWPAEFAACCFCLTLCLLFCYKITLLGHKTKTACLFPLWNPLKTLPCDLACVSNDDVAAYAHPPIMPVVSLWVYVCLVVDGAMLNYTQRPRTSHTLLLNSSEILIVALGLFLCYTTKPHWENQDGKDLFLSDAFICVGLCLHHLH